MSHPLQDRLEHARQFTELIEEFDAVGVGLAVVQGRVLSGAERLLLAVLMDALRECLAGTPPRLRSALAIRRGDEPEMPAADWVASDEADWPWSFVAICTHFGLDPPCVRAALSRGTVRILRQQSGSHMDPIGFTRSPIRTTLAAVGG